MKSINILSVLVFILCLNNIKSFAQSSNMIAQGNYYKAKELYENRNYKSAIDYIKRSKESLGGSNFQLQYLHIMSEVKLGNYNNANIEIARYFRLEDREETPIGFTKNVERLTEDETKQLTKILIDVQESASKETEQQKIANARKPIANEIIKLFDKAVGVVYFNEIQKDGKNDFTSLSYGYKRNGNIATFTISRKFIQQKLKYEETNETVWSFNILDDVRKIELISNSDGISALKIIFNKQIKGKNKYYYEEYTSYKEILKNTVVLEWGLNFESRYKGEKYYSGMRPIIQKGEATKLNYLLYKYLNDPFGKNENQMINDNGFKAGWD